MVAHLWLRDMACIPRHQLDDEITAELLDVARIEKALVARLRLDEEVDIAIEFGLHEDHPAGSGSARIQDAKAAGVVDAVQRLA